MPKSLYARALIIIIAPILILQSVLAFVFMERHWNTVTRRLSAAVTSDIAALLQMMEAYPGEEDLDFITSIAREQLNLNMVVLPPDPLPAPAPKPFFTLLDRTLSDEIRQRIGKPYWIDTVGRSNIVEIRIQLDNAVVQIFARRSQTYASNSHIFLLWMGGTAMVLLVIAIIFMRNQIRPIQRLANAAEDFGKGRDHPDFRPAGALEVRRASYAFLKMRARIQRQIEQRTAMLAGVSHDLRTILTRFRLQLAILGNRNDIKEMEQDVVEMQTMLEGYLDFAKGDVEEEESQLVDLEALLDELRGHAVHAGAKVNVSTEGRSHVQVRPGALKRCLTNLVGNAAKFASVIQISCIIRDGWLTVIVDDNGPGIPEDERKNVFRPFYRIDRARSQNKETSGTGLGLAIALDFARGHGGDITLGDSPLGGLRAIVSIPV
ncbi:MAG: ATP-binding protein [Pseudomonadota bacterium]